jgi:hypothetical protein
MGSWLTPFPQTHYSAGQVGVAVESPFGVALVIQNRAMGRGYLCIASSVILLAWIRQIMRVSFPFCCTG